LVKVGLGSKERLILR